MRLNAPSIAIALCVAAASGLSAATAGPICLQTYLVDSTKVVDSRTLDFRMKNGTVYRNTLRTPCPGLKFNGFVYKTHTGDICENMQTIRVLRSHEVCMLGTFTKLPATKPASGH